MGPLRAYRTNAWPTGRPTGNGLVRPAERFGPPSHKTGDKDLEPVDPLGKQDTSTSVEVFCSPRAGYVRWPPAVRSTPLRMSAFWIFY